MPTFTVDAGGPVLWCLRRRVSDVRCVLHVGSVAADVHVLQERELVLSERFPSEAAARRWADEYRARLLRQGWRDGPDDCSPSSAA